MSSIVINQSQIRKILAVLIITSVISLLLFFILGMSTNDITIVSTFLIGLIASYILNLRNYSKLSVWFIIFSVIISVSFLASLGSFGMSIYYYLFLPIVISLLLFTKKEIYITLFLILFSVIFHDLVLYFIADDKHLFEDKDLLFGPIMFLSIFSLLATQVKSKIDTYLTTTERISKELIQFIDTANAPIFGIDNKGEVNEWNLVAEKLTGYTKSELLGKNLVETLITFEFKDNVKMVLDNALKGKETSNYEFPLYSTDGNRLLILLNATTRRDKNGNIVGVIGIGQDITEIDAYRTKIEKTAREKSNELSKRIIAEKEVRNEMADIIASMSNGIIVMEGNEEIYLINSVSNKILEKDLKKNIMNFLFNIIEILDQDGSINPISEDIIIEGGIKDLIYRLNISEFNIEHKTGIICIIEDVTIEREVDRMKTEFITTASHELRTPLTSIQGFSEILLTKDNLSEEDKKRYLEFINSKSLSLSKIINDLLDISRLESGEGYKLDRVECDLGEGVKSVIDIFVAGHPEFEYILDLLDGKFKAYIDKEKIAQVLDNILNNAIKYSPNDKKIIIKSNLIDNHYVVGVTDHGIGIAEQQLARIFEKFYRIDATNPNIEGTGLGLSISKEIIELHGGELKVRSELGKGSTFEFSIPLQ